MKKYYVFGAGEIGKEIIIYLKSECVIGFIDNNEQKRGKTYCDYCVFMLEDVRERIVKDEDIYVVIAIANMFPVYQQLKENNIERIMGYDEIKYKQGIATFYNYTGNAIADKNIKKEIEEYDRAEIEVCDSIVLAGYNIDDLNIGCRATSQALYNILSKEYHIKNVIYRYELLDLFIQIDIQGTIFDFISTVELYPVIYQQMETKLRDAGMLVINGEGSFIFTNPRRKDLYVFCVLMYICIKANIPFCVVNAMMSAGNDGVVDKNLYSEVIFFLKRARHVVVRDPYSLELIERDVPQACFLPDALFSEYEYAKHTNSNHNYCANAMQYMGLKETDRYVILSGNSEAAHFCITALETFDTLVNKILDCLRKKSGLKLVLVQCCKGDGFLLEIGKRYNLPVVPVETDIKVLGYIFQNAECFISGRYHPSILASLGGTPCIFMGSNSHKTKSIQTVLEMQNVKEFSALPSSTECQEICDTLNDLIQTKYKNLRNEIRAVSQKNGREALRLAIKIK